MKQLLRLLLLIILGSSFAMAQNTTVVVTPNTNIPTNGVHLGHNVGQNMSSDSSVMIGSGAGQNSYYSRSSVYIGADAGRYSTFEKNVFIGRASGENNTNDENTFMGFWAGRKNTSGRYNLIVGSQAGYFNTTGKQNVFLGHVTGYRNTTGEDNTFVGRSAGFDNTTGTGNTFIGTYAGGFCWTSCNIWTESTNITGNYNVMIGYKAIPTITGLTNAIAIGSNAKVSSSNSMVLGGTGQYALNVGIGTQSPTAKLEIVSDASNTSGLKLTNLTNSSSISNSSDKVLSVDNTGNVILVSNTTNYFANPVGIGAIPVQDYILSICGRARASDLVADPKWCDYVFEKDYKLMSVSQLEAYVKQNKHLPEIPTAKEVNENGVALGEMTSKLLLKVEELTLYIIAQEKRIMELERQLIAKGEKVKSKK
ncbi:hypothetical protein [Emticicia sp. BO119]|uniref:hypothetical protein n=1 Tax=Emticicia sp. BO119 TaxID=2757768 RepID=UPI0015F05F3B|nr:hypothetical protein [Emticicia sp. BO119]MBA4851020.1 hypothetical protein [Emticicia sp. BO119]